MFLSAPALAIEYGIDERIAKFFVDREPPKDNLYWKDKLLYLRPQPGYIFIPLITDLYSRSGLPVEVLLDEHYVSTIETILHHAAEQESGMISYTELENKCLALVSQNTRNEKNLEELLKYFGNKPGSIDRFAIPFKALRRGDVFLFSLCVLDVPWEKFLDLVRTWFALIATLLMMDDSEDYLADLESGDENVFIESGSDKEGFERIKIVLAESLDHIQRINFSMAYALHKKVTGIPGKPGIKEYLNN